MIRVGVLVVVGLLFGCQSTTKQNATPKTSSNWKPWVLEKYDANHDGDLKGVELQAAIKDSRLERDEVVE